MSAHSNSFLPDSKAEVAIKLRHMMRRQPEPSNAGWNTQKRIDSVLQRFGLEGTRALCRSRGPRVRPEAVDRSARRDRRAAEPGGARGSVVSFARRRRHACLRSRYARLDRARDCAPLSSAARQSREQSARVLGAARGGRAACGRTVKKEKLLDGFECAVGFRMRLGFCFRRFAAREGAENTSSDQFKFTVTGKMSHGAGPLKGVDAINIAAVFVNEVQKGVSREIRIDDDAVVMIGTIHRGEATNSICGSVVMDGTIGTRSSESRTLLCQRVREVVEDLVALHRACLNASSMGESALFNDAEMVRHFGQLVHDTVGRDAFCIERKIEPVTTLGSTRRACRRSITSSAAERRATSQMCIRQHSKPPMISSGLRSQSAFSAGDVRFHQDAPNWGFVKQLWCCRRQAVV